MLDRKSKEDDDHDRDNGGDDHRVPDHDLMDLRSPSDQPEDRAREDDRRKHHVPDEDDTEQPDQGGNKEDDKDDNEKGGLWAALRRHKIAVAIAILVLVIIIVAAIIWYMHARNFESTDDAFIDGRPVVVSPEVSGNIVRVMVTDNELVHAGDLLAEIDPRNYRAAVQQANAQILQATASIATSRAQIETQKAQVAQAAKQIVEAQAALSFARDQNARAQHLAAKGFGTVQNAQQTASDLRSRQAALEAAIASRDAAQRQINVLEAQVKSGEGQLAQAQAQKAAAEANLSRTDLHATVDGRITRLTAAVGAAAMPGQGLMILVPTHLWVTANFKETQLASMKVGQPADIEIDAYGRTYPGHVNSIQAGSGTAFSLLPAENATGNYVKVVQRVPVKLTFDKLPNVEIGPGMSVVPTVRVH